MSNKQISREFLYLTLGVSLLLTPLLLAQHSLLIEKSLTLLYVWMPGLISLWLIKLRHRQSLARYGVRFQPKGNWLWALIIPTIHIILTLLLVLGMKWDQTNPQIAEQSLLPIFLHILTLSVTVNALLAFGEELGWRGVLFSGLRRLGFWRCHLTIGVIWGIWHIPLMLAANLYPDNQAAGFMLFFLATLLLSPIIGWVREQGQSVIASTLFHGMFNALTHLPIILLWQADAMYSSPLGLAGVI
ncbi:MAG: CPBP family intramembrane metalloprotease, partial [Gammaproteobacteria bacterium]|nr:CPBP family intramembrane metalloprotease [Gammaproteobacteria bacterium]